MELEPYDRPCQLMQETVRLVKEYGVSEASLKTRLPYGWLQKLVGGQFQNPSVNRVVHAYEVLSSRKLAI